MKAIHLFVILFVGELAYAQETHRVYYSKLNVKTDSAGSYYYREGKSSNVELEREVGTGNAALSSIFFPDTVFSYYTKSEKIKERAIYVDHQLQGEFVSFYPNGGIHQSTAFRQGNFFGKASVYYDNGKLQSTWLGSNNGSDPLIIEYLDSIGNKLVKEGNGFCGCYGLNWKDNSTDMRLDGKYANGRRDSVWLTYRRDTLVLKEQFHNGRLIDGVSYRGGNEFHYTVSMEHPVFPGGLEEMMAFLKNHMTYPKAARRRGSEGRVFVSFMVETTGQVSSVEIIKGIAPDCDAEAARVVSIMPKWKPGRMYGMEVRTRYVLPVNFALGK